MHRIFLIVTLCVLSISSKRAIEGSSEEYKAHRNFEIDSLLKNHIVLCTGPSFDRKKLLKQTTEQDLEIIQFKKIILVTNDPRNVDINFKGMAPFIHLVPQRDKQLDCLNCIILSIKHAITDSEINNDDIIIFKHESVYINDMNLIRKALSKILDGYDMVVKYWLGFENTKSTMTLNDYYHTDSFFIKVSAARQIFRDLDQVTHFTQDYQFCEEYFTKCIVSKIPSVYQINYHHSSWKDNELGFYHIPREDEDPRWYWDKKNYDQLYN